MAVSNAELLREVRSLSNRLIALEQLNYDMAAKFAYYYLGNRKLFAIITRLHIDRKTGKENGVADLVVFNHGWSGGHDVVRDCEMFVHDILIEDYEQQPDGKWEPMLELSHLSIRALKEFEANRPESQKAQDSESRKALFKRLESEPDKGEEDENEESEEE